MDLYMNFVAPSTMKQKNIEAHIMEKIALKGDIHNFYVNLIERQLSRDSVLVELIKEEVK